MAVGDAVQRVLSRCGSAVEAGEGKWKACCPAHDDRDPSLSIGQGDRGVTLKCWAGCTFDAIAAALRLEKRELFDDYQESQPGRGLVRLPAKAVGGAMAAPPANAKRPPVVHATREAAGAVTTRRMLNMGFTPAGAWDYRDAAGSVVAVVLRFDSAGGVDKEYRPLCAVSGGWVCKAPAVWPLYGLRDLPSDGSEPVFVPEGEKCVDAVAGLGLAAVGSAGGASGAKKTDWSPLAGRRVVLLPDNDLAGAKFASAVAGLLGALEPPAVVSVFDIPGRPADGGDVADLVAAAGDDDDRRAALKAQLLDAAASPAPAGGGGLVPVVDGAGVPANILRPETMNDIGLGRRLVEAAEGRVRYLVDRAVWVRWTGTHWVDDPKAAAAQRTAKAEALKLWAEMKALGRSNTWMVKFVQGAGSRRGIENAVAMARTEPSVEGQSSDFDADADILNVQNGILDLRKLELRPHDPGAFLTKLAPVVFDPTASAPKWRAFIDEVTCGDADLAGFLQRSFGLALSADQSEQRLWMHWGEGSNGKGTALAVLNRLMGSYAGPAPIEVFLATRGGGADRERGVARLSGLRLAFAQEADDGARLSEATVKALTGSDPLTGRWLYQNSFDVYPTWHLHMAVNDRPTIRGTDHGIWRRVLLVPWRHTFTGKRERSEVEADLFSESSGILNWLIAGYVAWRADGLRPPAAVQEATEGYRSESDSVRAWVMDSCIVEAGAMAGATDLFTDYAGWCKRSGIEAVSQAKFGRTLDALGHTKARPTGGEFRSRTVRVGLRLAFAAAPSSVA